MPESNAAHAAPCQLCRVSSAREEARPAKPGLRHAKREEPCRRHGFRLFTEILTEKRLHGTVKVELIFLIVETVPLVILNHILDRDTAFP